MILKRFLPYSAAIAMAFLPGVIRAANDIDSEAGQTTCFLSSAFNCNTTTGTSSADVGSGAKATSNGSTVAIVGSDVDSSWQQVPVVNPGDSSDSSANWIGAMDSGVNGTLVVQNDSAPAYQITSGSFTAGAGQQLDLDVWADDSVDVWLVNTTTSTPTMVEISPLSTITQASACSGQPVSCTPPTEGAFADALVSGDTYHLTFEVWQTGSGTTPASNPTGLLYTGAVVASPEPGAVTLLLTMMMAVAGVAGILKKKSA